jgi:tRNA pseudouridine38-40 synthase
MTALRLPQPADVTCAGRTDAGVHARGQVAHVDVPDPGSLPTLMRAMRGLLPDDVSLLGALVAPAGFHARFSALSRHYRYRICDSAAAWDPLLRREVLRYRRALDLDAMNQAAALLIGEHDFAALCKPRDGGTTVRRLLAAEWRRGATGHAEFTVSADAFCHSLVRSLVGALVPVGDGRQPIDWPAFVVAGRVRDSRATVMPAHGLVLERVEYPEDAHLAARQLVTRARRDS